RGGTGGQTREDWISEVAAGGGSGRETMGYRLTPPPAGSCRAPLFVRAREQRLPPHGTPGSPQPRAPARARGRDTRPSGARRHAARNQSAQGATTTRTDIVPITAGQWSPDHGTRAPSTGGIFWTAGTTRGSTLGGLRLGRLDAVAEMAPIDLRRLDAQTRIGE